MTEQISEYTISKIAPSPFNPRKHLGDLTELAASITQIGVQQPVVVRQVKGKAELVFGHRRLAASKLAGKDTIPTIVREYSDDDVLEVQIVENCQRADVHPLDEADGFAQLIKRGRTHTAIADKIGRTASYVAQRLQLCQLGKEGREALDNEELTLGAALVLARVPTSLQGKALEYMTENYSEDEHAAVSAKHARAVVEAEYMLKLERAPWNLDDDALVPKAGACMTCPKRTGNQIELFSDVKSPDMCTDRTCYRSKLDALWAVRKKDATEPLLEGEAAKKALGYGGGFKKLDDFEYVGSKKVDVRKLAGKVGAPITVARDPETGAHVELVRAADVTKAIKIAAPAASALEQKDDAAARRQDAKERKRRRLTELALEQAVAAAERFKGKDVLISIVVRAFCAKAWNEHQKAVLQRRELAADKRKHGTGNDVEAALLKLCDDATPAQRLALGVELALHIMAPSVHSPASAKWGAVMKALGVNLGKLERQVDAEEAERTQKKREATKKKAKRAKAAQ